MKIGSILKLNGTSIYLLTAVRFITVKSTIDLTTNELVALNKLLCLLSLGYSGDKNSTHPLVITSEI